MQASCALNIYQYFHISNLIKTSINLYTYLQNSSCTYNMLARESFSKETAEYISKSDYPLPLLFMTSRLEMHHLVVIFDNDLFHFESWTNQKVSFITVMVFYSKKWYNIYVTMPCQSEMTFTKQCMPKPNKKEKKLEGKGANVIR